MVNRVQLRYKRDTGMCPLAVDHHARVGKWGDIIISDPDNGLVKFIEARGVIEIPSAEYVNWLEELAIEYFKLKQEVL